MKRSAAVLVTAGIIAGAMLATSSAVAAPARVSDKLFAMEVAHTMVGSCAHLDEAAQTSSAALSSQRRYDSTILLAKRRGYAAAVKRAQQKWATMRDGVDTSCIVGPDETRQAAYASLITDLENATGAVQSALNARRKGRRGR